MIVVAASAGSSQAWAKGRLGEFLTRLQPAEIDPEADRFGDIAGDPPVAPLLRQGMLVGYAFLNADIVDATGYSGKPINIVIGLDRDGRITGAKLVEHHEPIVLVGIAEAKVVHFIDGYIGRNVLEPGADKRTPVDIVSGATVSMIVIGDSIMRSSIKVAHAQGIGGAVIAAAPIAQRELDLGKREVATWTTLLGDGSVRRLSLSNDAVNAAFARTGNAEAIARPETGPPDAPFVDLYVALASIPTIGRSLLGDAEYETLVKRLKPGQQAILIAGDGPYSFRGSGYVRGGIFDRIEVIQADASLRFHDRDYKRIGSLAPEDAPDFPEIGLFVTPDGTHLDPTQPWRLQLLLQRRTGAMDKAFTTVEIGYAPPETYLKTVTATPIVAPVSPPPATAAVPVAEASEVPLWQRVWQSKAVEIGVLLIAIGLLTGFFFFQDPLVKRPVLYKRLRLGFLAFTLLWLGWYEHAQLSVVNVFTFFGALRGNFRWDYFLLDPPVFILWCSAAAALLFWGRGAYCGWLCPFGALQEWTNHIARLCRVPQWTVPFGLHQRLWPIKYMVFLGLFGISLGSLAMAEELAEIEPFKTAIILHFVRDWWFVLFALAMLAPGLFVERFYCRYMCPLGGALAIPARLRMFDWLRRYRECGSPCQRCGIECPVQAIHPEGHINPNECIQCLNCQVLYHHDQKCPVMIQKRIKREKRLALSSASMRPDALPRTKSTETVGGER